MAPKAILLDALGTLVALEPPAPRLRDELAARFGVSVSEAEAARALAAEIAYYRAHLDEGRDAGSLAELRARCATVLRDALPRAAVAAIPPGAMTEALLAALRFRAFDDAAPALLAARSQGRRLVVVSNWDISLNEVLDRLGLAPLLDGIVTSAAAGACKPAPAIFARALGLAGARAEEAVHVGDSVEEDVAGARAAGIEPILIQRDGGAASRVGGVPPGVATIASLSELS